MGLDFTIYKKKVNETCGEAWKDINKWYNENGYDKDCPRELAYGRKSWELVHALFPCSADYNDPENDPIVTKERWDMLMSKISIIADTLDDVIRAFEIEENLPDDYAEMVFTDTEKKFIAEYELWYNKSFGETPTLGYYFSTGYIYSFWKANEEVQKVFEDPEWELRACVSY